MDKKLEVKNLQISFRTQGGILKAVRNISFDLYNGETLAIVGESGSGKSVTSKAIMGILAGNSIVEGGEILYDGQDLLKISEEDFHKLRGDKVAMIFQDPMSSLNPIMRVGQQLTEAMILKAKTGKKNARNAFNSKLKLLGENINAADKAAGVDNSADVAAKLKKFNAFCVTASKIELEYNEANGNAMQLEIDLENALLMLEKQKKFDIVAEAKRYRKLLLKSINPYVVPKGEKSDALVASLTELIGKGNGGSTGTMGSQHAFGSEEHSRIAGTDTDLRVFKVLRIIFVRQLKMVAGVHGFGQRIYINSVFFREIGFQD
jgi:ABC-type antimicrobial peptide transport system ATPase subunit